MIYSPKQQLTISKKVKCFLIGLKESIHERKSHTGKTKPMKRTIFCPHYI